MPDHDHNDPPAAEPQPQQPRRHQELALRAIGAAWQDGARRAWVVLPPGAGKTLVGLWAARDLLTRPDDPIGSAVVFGPNTAIQGQWLSEAEQMIRANALSGTAGTDRELTDTVTALTYQSLAVFDPDAEVDDDGVEQSLLSRLHDNGTDLVHRLRSAGPVLIVLDECHHLLQVWGELLDELLAELPEARVLGLTATPPDALTRSEADLVHSLFGEIRYQTSIPALVRDGDLAPFTELAWLTTPTRTEAHWLTQGAVRFAELCAYLTDPAHGSIGFLSWLDRRFVTRTGDATSWPALATAEPELCAAALRMHHAGLLGMPEGARTSERDRRRPTADDWMTLVDDWVQHHLQPAASDAATPQSATPKSATPKSADPSVPHEFSRRGGEELTGHPAAPSDQEVIDTIRRALPGIGYRWTRHGIRSGRSPVDRVLARSEAKSDATVRIVEHESTQLGSRLRMLVLCDHERATATVPSALEGVLDAQAGSARATLQALLASATTAALDPILVTGATVAGSPETLQRLADWAGDGPAAVRGLEVVRTDGLHQLVGRWSSQQWVRVVTRFFEEGRCQVLVGTRALLGEGWDARRVSGLIDLTSATTPTAVVQTRGRALRTDPTWPEKVAITWSVVAVADDHPNGDTDWGRFVRKHSGFWGVDDAGEVVDGVGHLDPRFSPWQPPSASEFDAVNASMIIRSQERDRLPQRWRVGEPYDDRAVHTVRILPRGSALSRADTPVPTVIDSAGAVQARESTGRARIAPVPIALGLVAIGLFITGVITSSWVIAAVAPLCALAGYGLHRLLGATGRARQALQQLAEPPSIPRIAAAVADGLQAAGLVAAGAESVRTEIDADGRYRCSLSGVAAVESERFATALDEAIGVLQSPRYLISRRSPRTTTDPTLPELITIARGRPIPYLEGWHAVPSALGTNAERAQSYAAAWRHWVGDGRLLYTGSPEGAGIMTAQHGSDPFDVSTLMRTRWE